MLMMMMMRDVSSLSHIDIDTRQCCGYSHTRLQLHTTCSYNGTNGIESKTTCMFRPVPQMAAPGPKSAVSDRAMILRKVSPHYRPRFNPLLTHESLSNDG